MEPEKKSHGALIGSIIIIVILLIGGIYIWQKNVKEALIKKTEQEKNQSAEIIIDENELNSLEQELNDTDTTVDVDVNAIQ